MKINHVIINRSDITKENVSTQKYSYSSKVNNNTSDTSEKIIESAVSVLLDIYNSTSEDAENETKEVR